jgi:uncharacterized surface protein with fasciclin (FAS1) repeats
MKKLNLIAATAAAALLACAAYAQTPPAGDGTVGPNAAPEQMPADAAPAPTAPATPDEAMPAPSPAPTKPATATPAPTMAAPTGADAKLVANGDIVDTLKASGQFTTLVKALDATNLTSVLKTNQNLTLFAPTDAAFAALPAGELDKLMADPAALQKVLTFHVINAKVDTAKLKGAKGPVNTVNGAPILLDGSGEKIMAGNGAITQADVMPTNGVIHVVDKVLMPTTASAAATDMPADAAAPAATASAASKTVTNGPVADTASSRAKAPPQSKAGKQTAPVGN